ncbi:hypothetical protein HDU91_002483 [Kappamyces sp. JEL0680]|nr:hypothetical protein HDU91_002483 [Kappamyces sp. JEL0680]
MGSTAAVVKELAQLNEQTWLQIGKPAGMLRVAGQVSENMNDFDRAVSAYENALRHNPYAEQTLTLAATLCRSLEKYGKAAEYFQRILKLNESNGEIWGALGHCYLMLDELHKAYSAYQQALYHLPNPRANEIYFRLGIIYKHEGKYENSLECFKYIMASPPPPLTELDIRYQIGLVYEQQKEYALARDAYEKVLEDSPKHAKVLQQLGWLYHQPNTGFTNDAQAVIHLTKSLDHDQQDAQTWYLLGRCYMSQQKFNDAYNAYQQAVYRDGRNPNFWCSIGVLYYTINQYPDALDAYGRAIRINPYISEVWYAGAAYE